MSDLTDQEQRELLLGASPLPTWVIDRETERFLFVNDAALREYGYSREEFLATSIESIRVPEETGPHTPYMGAQSPGPAIVSGLRHHRRKDGSVFQVRLSAENILFAGRPAVLTQVLEPERGDALSELTIRERQLAEAQALAHVGSWELDIPANHVTWSTELYRIYGIPLTSPQGYNEFLGRIYPDDRARVDRIVADGLARRRPWYEFECRIRRPTGEIRHTLNRNVVSVDAAGQPVRMAGTTLDVTDQRRVEQALSESERHHRELVENASDLVTVLSVEGVVQYMSPSAQRLLGYGPAELLGHSVFEFVHPDDAPPVADTIRRDMAAPGTPNAVAFRIRHRGGGWRVLEAIGQAHEVRPGEYGIIVNSRDVTDRKLSEEVQQSLMRELRVAHRAAEAATRAKSEFLASMSHEIRTPLHAILGLTELLLDTELTAEQRRQLELANDAGDVLLTLLNDILDFSKIEAQHVDLEAIAFDLPALVHTTARLFAVATNKRNLELLVDVGADLPRYVRGDPTRLRQILTNLLDNAVKFTDHGEIVVAANLDGIGDGIGDGRATVRLAVRDTGIGIGPDKTETIFTEFSQVDASTTRRYGGTGLGLAIARRLVRLMGGDIAVASVVGQGTTFSFTLTWPVEPLPSSEGVTAPVPMGGARVLVVDDNATSRRILRESLAPAGATIGEAASADAALVALEGAIAEGLPYAVALLDSEMPDRDGWSLAAEIRRRPALAATRLLMLTPGQRSDGAKCRERGIEGYLLKPVLRTELVAAIVAVLAGRGTWSPVMPRRPLTVAAARLRILLAEDNAVNQEVATAMLRKRGHEITVVDNGAKAVAAVRTGAFDVVLMDIHMPEMDGLAATAAIRALPGRAALPIIALTADALTGERERCLAAGMNGYLSKPFKSHELFAAVEGLEPPPDTTQEAADANALPPVPADIAGFRATMRQAGAEGAVDGILDLFIADAPQRRANLAAALDSGRATDIQSAAHVFKSAAGTIGARSLATVLLTIELAGMEGRVDDARSLAGGMENESDAVVAYLRGLRAETLTHA